MLASAQMILEFDIESSFLLLLNEHCSGSCVADLLLHR